MSKCMLHICEMDHAMRASIAQENRLRDLQATRDDIVRERDSHALQVQQVRAEIGEMGEKLKVLEQEKALADAAVLDRSPARRTRPRRRSGGRSRWPPVASCARHAEGHMGELGPRERKRCGMRTRRRAAPYPESPSNSTSTRRSMPLPDLRARARRTVGVARMQSGCRAVAGSCEGMGEEHARAARRAVRRRVGGARLASRHRGRRQRRVGIAAAGHQPARPSRLFSQ